MREDAIYITDENGKEVEMRIFLTFDINDKKYVLVYNDDNVDDLYPFIYDEEGNLYQVESDEELQLIEEVLSAYEEEEKK
jgi:uncharacterized protein YrzB (UPF0473 family)